MPNKALKQSPGSPGFFISGIHLYSKEAYYPVNQMILIASQYNVRLNTLCTENMNK